MSDKDKRYPTRMHEVLGVETGELFSIYEFADDELAYVDANGNVLNAIYNTPVGPNTLTVAINHGITRKPLLSEEQVRQLKALATLGFYWLVKRDEGGYAYATENKPHNKRELWEWFGSCFRLGKDGNQGVLYSLVSWSDPEPLDIVATLKAAGVEVE